MKKNKSWYIFFSLKFFFCFLHEKQIFIVAHYKDKTASPFITTSNQEGQQPNSKDGSLLGNPEMADARGILRNSSRLWVFGFSLNLGIASNNMAELGAIRFGIVLAWNLSFIFIYLETDSTTIISWLTNDSVSLSDVVPLIFDYRNFMA